MENSEQPLIYMLELNEIKSFTKIVLFNKLNAQPDH